MLTHSETMFHRERCNSAFDCPVCNVTRAIKDLYGAKGWLAAMQTRLANQNYNTATMEKISGLLPELRRVERFEFERWRNELSKVGEV